MISQGHVVITGASSGIGAALARHWMRPGARLTLVARREDALRALQSEAKAHGAAVHVAPADLSDPDAASRWIAAAEAALGPVDTLIMNAGMQLVGPASAMSVTETERQLQVNFLAPLRQARHVLPAMLARGSGNLVAVSSVAGLTHTPQMADYSATKAALAAFFETLRVELTGTGVHVLTVYPGPVATPLESAARARLADTAAQRVIPTGTPAKLAQLIEAALTHKKGNLIYPRLYETSRLFPGLSQWLTNRLAPPAREER